ncbi:CPBP family intramembrane metalloprotease [Salinibacterium sp. SWN139]|uniref:CPBP family glutamic-type intramembrane protease n=1 Tax=Salinibacterium sp. SWN139 TaxID=2792055 RepID=UPI0018CE5CC5|nr:CPBP family glutamic-type intramembrane protease [Salinibacterium sp. SWN139]MBH0053022.1 CPBP family intramembrane metalloprotease [Salinibacterium sp. SWN139]
MPGLDNVVSSPPLSSRSWGLVPAALLSGSAVLLFSLRLPLLGYVVVALALAAAWLTDRNKHTEGLAKDLLLIAVGMIIVSTVSVEADISWGNFFLLGFVLAAAVAVPYALSRFVFKDRLIRFPWRGGWPWNRVQWGYLFLVLFLGWLILPFYFITSGVYLNWPIVTTPDEIGRLFVGVNAVGTWDELFFILTVFVLFRRHFPVWQANLLQMVIFVAFLWELGYQSWGPLLTIPFALLQGWIYSTTKSLVYVLSVHLLFDAVVFLVIVHARNPGVIGFFLL